jgi:di/tricarboxylate transporter
MLIMAVFWITEALPINVTALLPVFMFPFVGVLSAGEVASVYFNVRMKCLFHNCSSEFFIALILSPIATQLCNIIDDSFINTEAFKLFFHKILRSLKIMIDRLHRKTTLTSFSFLD